jgi:hypothetical protein
MSLKVAVNICQAAPSVYPLPLGRGLLCPCVPRLTVVALRGLEAVRQSRLHLRVVQILWSYVAHSEIQRRGLMERTQT